MTTLVFLFTGFYKEGKSGLCPSRAFDCVNKCDNQVGRPTKCLPRVAWWPSLLGAYNRVKPKAIVPKLLHLYRIVSTVPTGVVCSQRKFYMKSHVRKSILLPLPLPSLLKSVLEFEHSESGTPSNCRENPFQAGRPRSASASLSGSQPCSH